jgi:hypothetical protein
MPRKSLIQPVPGSETPLADLKVVVVGSPGHSNDKTFPYYRLVFVFLLCLLHLLKHEKVDALEPEGRLKQFGIPSVDILCQQLQCR